MVITGMNLGTNLPRGGLQVLREVRQHLPGVPLALFTGTSFDDLGTSLREFDLVGRKADPDSDFFKRVLDLARRSSVLDEPFDDLNLAAIVTLTASEADVVRRNFERFYAYVEQLIQSGDLTNEDQRRAEKNWSQLSMEWDGDDEPRGAIIRTTTASLLTLAARYTPYSELTSVVGTQASSAIQAAIRETALLESADDDSATAPIATIARLLAESLPSRTGRRTWIAETAGWASVAGAGAGTGATLSAVKVLSEYPVGMTAGWGSIIGALVGMMLLFSVGRIAPECHEFLHESLSSSLPHAERQRSGSL